MWTNSREYRQEWQRHSDFIRGIDSRRPERTYDTQRNRDALHQAVRQTGSSLQNSTSNEPSNKQSVPWVKVAIIGLGAAFGLVGMAVARDAAQHSLPNVKFDTK
jgi:hypothetical protein